ncbi:MAG TPA: threonine synthase [Balneolales bacterium]|nr:threonine synthase [Balneolales bacterium]
MRFLSTNNKNQPVSFYEAVLQGLADDGGLYMPENIPQLSDEFWQGVADLSFKEIAFNAARPFVRDELNDIELQAVIDDAFSFDAPLIPLDDKIYVAELFHGPTLAFKDFGARFMSRVFSAMNNKHEEVAGQKRQQDLKEHDVYILVATSGDTGSAVAHGFLAVPGIKVCLLYPSGKVSKLQEQQLTTVGGNVTAIEVDGTFDDCQKMVKQAFSDVDLRSEITLSSANSINFARLLPQSFYYIYSYAQLKKLTDEKPVFCVPSGNMGNLTGGLLAMQMGMPVDQFIVATNVNDVVPEYLRKGVFTPRPSVRTLSNAMDVGNPSNLDRIRFLFGDSISMARKHLYGSSFNDDQTRDAIQWVHQQTGYVLDPHTAVGYLASEEYRKTTGDEESSIILVSTAHPAKFRDTVESVIGESIAMPKQLQECMEKPKQAIPMNGDYSALRSFLLDHHAKVEAEN